MTINPNDRIEIEDVYKHKLFEKLRMDGSFYYESRKRFRKLLRGNYSLMNPKTLTMALTVDLIGMRAGSEIFSQLQTVVFVS